VGENNKEFAKTLLSRVETEVPKEIEKEIHVPNGYKGTICRLMTVDDEIKLLNPGYAKSTAIRYAVLLGAASLLIAAVTVILIEKADKRLKNLDFISKKLDLPILAVVPSIKMEENDETEVK
jgi:capsular polysaccharide biosynthesis protein